MLYCISNNNAIFRLYYISFNMLYNKIYQYAINDYSLLYSIKYVQIYHHI